MVRSRESTSSLSTAVAANDPLLPIAALIGGEATWRPLTHYTPDRSHGAAA
jgi:hypothetical protein